LPKTSFSTNRDWGMGQRSTPEILGPLLISTTAGATDFKFGIQLGLQEYDTKTTFTAKNGMGVG